MREGSDIGRLPDQPAGSARAGVARFSLWMFLAGLFGYVFVRNFWVGDDAYIIFRTVDNFIHGYGLRWNVAERVQTFTSPLWTLLVSALHAITAEIYYSTFGLSFLLCATALVLVWRKRRGEPAFLLLMLLLVSSKAFTDYTSSGLEMPLSYFLAVLFYREFLSEQPWLVNTRSLFYLSFVASLAFTTRPDTALLYLLPMTYLILSAAQERPSRLLPVLALGALPALAWEAFSILYYGFPWPNSYYAKLDLGLPAAVLLRQGFHYLSNSFRFDPVTLAVICGAVLCAVVSRKARHVVAAVSAVVYVLYAVWIGGDFMIGRFFALPFLISALVLAASGNSLRILLLSIAVIVYNVLHPWVPLKTDPRGPWNHPYTISGNIYDEAGGYRRGTSLMLYYPFSGDRPALTFPKHPQYEGWARWGTRLKEAGARVGVPLRGGVGFIGYFAGPTPHIIDAYAVTDPFLARLPIPEDAMRNYAPGHIMRTIPAGYVDSVLAGGNKIAERELSAYYGKLSLITRGDLWSRERLRCILELNLGSGRKFDRAPVQAADLPREGFLFWR